MEIKRFDVPVVEYQLGEDKVYRQSVLTDEIAERVLELLMPVLKFDFESLTKAKDLPTIAGLIGPLLQEVKGITELKSLLLTDVEGNPIEEPVPIEVLREAIADFFALNENWIEPLKSSLSPFSKTGTQILSQTGQKRKSGSTPRSPKTRSTTKG